MAAMPNEGPDTEAPSSRPEEGVTLGSREGPGQTQSKSGQPTFLTGLGGVGMIHKKPSPSPRGVQSPSVHRDSGEQKSQPAESIAQKKKIANILLPPPPSLATLCFQGECCTPC